MTNIKPILFRDKKNVVPLPYRNVSNQPYDGEMSAAKISGILVGKTLISYCENAPQNRKQSRQAVDWRGVLVWNCTGPE